MQTFLPYSDYQQTAKCLDYRRLGKQRVEAYQIYKLVSGERTTGGWINHPAVKMWHGYPDALAQYQNAMIDEWIIRGYRNKMDHLPVRQPVRYPDWLGYSKLHESHQSNLLSKDLQFYSKYKWDVVIGLPYYWPTEQMTN